MEGIPQAVGDATAVGAEVEIAFLERLFADVDAGGLRWRFPDGTTWGQTGRPPRTTLVLNHAGALRRMFLPPDDLAVGEAYIFDDYDIEGDIEYACGVLRDAARHRSPWEMASLMGLLIRLPTTPKTPTDRQAARLAGGQHSRHRDRQAIRYHYDVGNDFYALWLDDDLVYSCGYFPEAECGINAAQRTKLDRICRKLRLSPGQRLLDIGCGWGGLVRHAAREYGVDAIGITLSEEQAKLARARIASENLDGRARVEVLDYRDAPQLGVFDRLVSVGMFEHVGSEKLGTYFRTAEKLLPPGGLFLNHGIATAETRRRTPKRRSFLQRYVFPDGELEPLSRVLTAAEQVGFEVRDVESLREHYMMTLRHWIRRLEDHADEAAALTNEATYRVWRLYMAGSADAFRRGSINVYQSLLAKPTGTVSGLPLTRHHMEA